MAAAFYTVLFGICLLMVLVLNYFLNSYLRYPRDENPTAFRKRLNPFLTIPDLPMEPLNSLGGWAVQEACRYPMEVLFFVHTATTHWTHRAAYRDTLADPPASSLFNWTMVFFIGRADDNLLTSLWNRLEAEALGDLVILPFLDTYRNLSAKFVGGMQWVLTHCSKVRYIVKLDDDLVVEPFRLTEYLRCNMKPDSRNLHCSVLARQSVIRHKDSPWFVPQELFQEHQYYVYCAGMAIIMTLPVMRDLYRWSRLIPPYSVDDAYVTGDLALAARVGHVYMNAMFSWGGLEDILKPVDIFKSLKKSIIFVHLNKGHISVIRPMWRLMLWNQALRNPLSLILLTENRVFETQWAEWKTIRADLSKNR